MYLYIYPMAQTWMVLKSPLKPNQHRKLGKGAGNVAQWHADCTCLRVRVQLPIIHAGWIWWPEPISGLRTGWQGIPRAGWLGKPVKLVDSRFK